MSKEFPEKDMYDPIKNFLSQLGYKVNGEVKGIDVTAVKDNQLVVVELKKNFNLTLINQGIERQKITPLVYLAIPRPKKMNSKNFNSIMYIVKKLELGLIIVAMDSPLKIVEVVLHPQCKKKINEKECKAIFKELTGRTVDENKGGSNRKKLLTAYRERCIKIACILKVKGPLAPRVLVKEYNCEKDCGNILLRNQYNWFYKVSKGIYDLSEKGKQELLGEEFKSVIDYYISGIK